MAYHTDRQGRDDSNTIDGPEESGPADASLWGRMLTGVKSALGLSRDDYGDALAGYVGIWLQGDQAHITEIAVREELRGRGIGELLIIGTLRVAYEQGLEEVTLEARVSNFVAQRLYDKYGFNEVGIRKNYYADNREDAVIMTTDHIHTAALPRKVRYPARQLPGPLRRDADRYLGRVVKLTCQASNRPFPSFRRKPESRNPLHHKIPFIPSIHVKNPPETARCRGRRRRCPAGMRMLEFPPL